MPDHRWPFFGVPPDRKPRPAADEPALRGKRVILSTGEGFVYDMRAATDAYPNADGKPTVDIVTEEAWYRWMFTRQPPERVPYPITHVWVD
jgi:hypothetical protein